MLVFRAEGLCPQNNNNYARTVKRGITYLGYVLGRILGRNKISLIHQQAILSCIFC